MRFGNCWLYARRKLKREGGFILAQRSHYGWWKHYFHMDRQGVVTDFVPAGPKRRRWFPPLLFFGVVRTLVTIDAAL